jgi:hypothetical protein
MDIRITSAMPAINVINEPNSARFNVSSRFKSIFNAASAGAFLWRG